jgi:hypothetical protein
MPSQHRKMSCGWGICSWALALAGFALAGSMASCSGASQPDPPDSGGAGGGSSDDDCPSDLPRSDVCATGTPSYELEAAPIILERCATCHYAGNNRSSYVFAERDDVSFARQTVLSRIYSCVMPPDGAPPLRAEERRVLLAWLVCGAPDN